MNAHIVQLVPWRDTLLALDSEGAIWRLLPDSDYKVEGGTWVLLQSQLPPANR